MYLLTNKKLNNKQGRLMEAAVRLPAAEAYRDKPSRIADSAERIKERSKPNN